MDLLVHARNLGTIETVDFTRRTYSEEGENCRIDRKGYGRRFLGFTRCDLHLLPGEGQNSHRLYYAELLGRFDAEMQKERPHLTKKKMLSTMTIMASAHISAVATIKLIELDYELLPHPPYSPDLTPCDFFCFQT